MRHAHGKVSALGVSVLRMAACLPAPPLANVARHEASKTPSS